jgi:nucleotide-binding universal stress UspA family protein
MFKKILFATDGSAASDHAAAMAVSLARTHDAHLTAVYVVDPYPYLGIGEMNPLGFQSYMAAAQEHAVKAFEHVLNLAEAQTEQLRVKVETRLVENMTALKGILQTAETIEADLIIVGSHGRSGWEKLIVGSTASKVVTGSVRPVLVVR